MKYLSIFATLTTSLVVALNGCAPVGDEEVETSSSSEEALTVTRPVTPAECSAFKNGHPTTPATLSTGDVVGTPFRACDLNTGAIFGSIDLAVAQQLLAGTGYTPITVHKGGKTTGQARLYFVNYVDTDLGPYNEFILLVDGVEDGASNDAKNLRWVNPYSALLPAFDPRGRTYLHQLILSKEAAAPIAYGRELLGLDKRTGTVDLVQSSSGMTFSVKDETGAPVVRGSFRPDKRVTSLFGMLGGLAGAAIGELVTPADLSMRLHPLTLNQLIEVDGVGFSHDPLRDGEIAKSKATYKWFPTMNPATTQTLDVQLDASSRLGKMLTDAHFTPTTVVTAEHVSMVYTKL